MGIKVERMILNRFTKGGRNNNMELIKKILRDENLDEVIKRVKLY